MNKIIVLDIETTAFTPEKGTIVEIGMVELDLDNGNIRVLLDTVCKERGYIDPEAWIFKNSSLKIEDVESAPSFRMVEQAIQGILDRYPLGATAYNRDFDMNFLKHRDIVFPKLQPCPMLAATPICQLPGKRGSFKWPKVEEAWSFFFPDDEYTEEHRGADDAVHEAKILYEMYCSDDYAVDRATK